MVLETLVKDKNFVLVNSEVKPDERKRIAVGKRVLSGRLYNVYENKLGQIILDPLEVIPRSEMWLHKNKKALASVLRGIQEASEGKLADSPEDI